METNNKLYRFITKDGEGVWAAGKRLLPKELVNEANENRSWLPKPNLPDGNYHFFMTEAGKVMYEKTLLKVHQKYLPNISLLEVARSDIKNIVYEDKYQVVQKLD